MSDAGDKELFVSSCREAASFPRNLVYHDTYEHNLKAYVRRLDVREDQLFCRELNSILDLWEYDDVTTRFRGKRIRGTNELKTHLSGDFLLGKRDPKCRFMFIHAPNSREWLNTSRNMVAYALSYHQAMPSFLDFLFPFGRQEHARDFHFSGFRNETRLDPNRRGLQIPELGRSGREIRMCYSLKSVEESIGQQQWPWSIRQTAVYHSLDIETGVMSWVVVKGNQLIQRRMESVTESRTFRGSNDFNTPVRAFVASLALHLVICDWCGEDWRWYISFLEECLQEKTRRTLAVPLESVPSTFAEKPSQALTWSTISSSIPEKRVYSGLSSIFEKSEPMAPPELPSGPPPPPPGRPSVAPIAVSTSSGPDYGGDFSFGDLPRVQHLEDKANEVLLILESNTNVLTELEQHYELVRENCGWPHEVSHGDFSRFKSRLASIVNDLRMQQSRTKTLLRLIADRKSLLHGILEYRNTEASKLLATKAQQSSENMEFMTKDMHIIAQKTKQETVSMRIITLVTLFFLPGTFISTIMSTDIVRFEKDNAGKSSKIFQLGAIQLYLAITLPLTFLVFVAWYGVYWWVDKKEVVNRRRRTGTMAV